MALFATPTDFWTLSAPPLGLFDDPRMTRGNWTSPVKVGTGGGEVDLDPASNPRDAYQVVVRVTRAGELNTAGQVNTVGVPRLVVSLDGGTSWSRPLVPDTNGQIVVLDAPVPPTFSKLGLPASGGGFVLQMQNAAAGTPVVFGAGGAAVTITALIGGLQLRLVQAPTQNAAISTSYISALGQITVTLGTDAAGALASTAAQVVAYLQGSGLPISASGSGAGIVQPAAFTALPFSSFVLGDSWSFSTNPSPDVVAMLLVESDTAAGYVRDTFSGEKVEATDPLTRWGGALVGAVTDRTRWRLLGRIGQDKHKDATLYKPERADAWLDMVAEGHVQPTATEQGPARSFPLLVAPIDPLSAEAGAFAI